MRKIILMMALSAFATVAIAAAPIYLSAIEQKARPTPEERAKAEVIKLTKELGLSANQAAKIKTLALEKHKAQDAVRKNNKGNEEAIKAESKKLSGKYAADLKNILTPEQYTKFKANRGKKKGAGKAKK